LDNFQTKRFARESKAEARLCVTKSHADNLKSLLHNQKYFEVGFNDRFYVQKKKNIYFPEGSLCRIRYQWYPQKKIALIYDRYSVNRIATGQFIKRSMLLNDKIELTSRVEGQAEEFLKELGFVPGLEITRLEPTLCYKPKQFNDCCELYLENIEGIGYMIEVEVDTKGMSEKVVIQTFQDLVLFLKRVIKSEDLDFIDGSLHDFVCRFSPES